MQMLLTLLASSFMAPLQIIIILFSAFPSSLVVRLGADEIGLGFKLASVIGFELALPKGSQLALS